MKAVKPIWSFNKSNWKNYCPKPERPCIQGSKSLGYRAFLLFRYLLTPTPAVPAPARPWATTVQMICPPPATIPMRQHPLRLQQMQQMQHRSRLSSRQIQVIWIPSDLYLVGKQNAKGVLSTQPRGESGKETPYFTQQNWVI